MPKTSAFPHPLPPNSPIPIHTPGPCVLSEERGLFRHFKKSESVYVYISNCDLVFLVVTYFKCTEKYEKACVLAAYVLAAFVILNNLKNVN